MNLNEDSSFDPQKVIMWLPESKSKAHIMVARIILQKNCWMFFKNNFQVLFKNLTDLYRLF